ncbi:MAG: zinc ribbon domain-containing protein [Anaerolineae bacterium]|nr:zinc ribbon domain-containing protein [Anaerolineae bacterium]MDW8071528.1 zinc ribbon domain-containing protein [Anaerolineae bacterium]
MFPFLGLALVLIGGVLAFVLWPLRGGSAHVASEMPGSGSAAWEAGAALPLTRAALLARREALYAALRDAEFDHAMGKLATADYQALHRQLTREAAQVLRQLDHLTLDPETVYAQEIEQAVLRLRTAKEAATLSLPVEVREAVEAEVAQLIKRATIPDRPAERTCPHCGQICQPEDLFCMYCGARLGRQEPGSVS